MIVPPLGPPPLRARRIRWSPAWAGRLQAPPTIGRGSSAVGLGPVGDRSGWGLTGPRPVRRRRAAAGQTRSGWQA